MKILINGIGSVGKSTLRKRLSSDFPSNVITVDMNYTEDIPSVTEKIVIVESTHSIEKIQQTFDKILYMLPPKNHIFLWLGRGWVWFSTGLVFLSNPQGKQKPFALSNIPIIIKILFRNTFFRRKWVKDDLHLLKEKFGSITYISHSFDEGYNIVKSWIESDDRGKQVERKQE